MAEEKSFSELYDLGRKALEVLTPMVDLVEALGDLSELEVRVAAMEPQRVSVAKEIEKMEEDRRGHALKVEGTISELDRHAAVYADGLQKQKDSLEKEIVILRDQRIREQQGRLRDQEAFDTEMTEMQDFKITLTNEIEELGGRVASLKGELEATLSKYAPSGGN